MTPCVAGAGAAGIVARLTLFDFREPQMDLQPGHYITLGTLAVAFTAWLVRLEGRVNAMKEHLSGLDKEVAATNAKAEAESKAHRDTSDALIRVEEAVKHLTRLFEQQFTANARRAERKAPE